ALRELIGTVIPACESPRHEQTLAGARAALGDDAFAAAWQQGTLAPLEDLEPELPAAAGGSAAPVPGPVAAAVPISGPADSVPPPGPAQPRPGAPRPRGARAATPDGGGAGAPTPGAGGPQTATARPPGAGAAAARAAPAPAGVLRIRALGEATVSRGDIPLTA